MKLVLERKAGAGVLVIFPAFLQDLFYLILFDAFPKICFVVIVSRVNCPVLKRI